ncbi:protein phosphatase 1 regulatory subunit 42, partial [bacterium]|nr:protein phosphatase 1 regulatory subunit 42 [bacterium]
MNKKTISIKGLLTALMMLVAVPLSLCAQDEEPIITLRTTSPACTIFLGGNADKAYIDVDCGNGPEEKEVVPAVLNPTTGEWTGTSFTCNPVNGLIRIYGEAENIVMLNLDGCYITQADLSKLVNLEFLFMKHNELESLDLSAIHRLKYIEVTDSPMNKGYFRIGKQPELMILSIEQTGNLSPDFTLADYPKLKVFTCWGNPDITEVDP